MSAYETGRISSQIEFVERSVCLSSGFGTRDDIIDVIWNLNATLRKCPGCRTLIEAFAVNLGVTLDM